MDDLSDDESDDMGIKSREFDRMSNDLLKEGYREGLAAGQEEQLQNGFNIGFNHGASILMQLSLLRGKLGAALAYDQILENTVLLEDQKTYMNDILSQLMELEKEITQLSKTENVKFIIGTELSAVHLSSPKETEFSACSSQNSSHISKTSSISFDDGIPECEHSALVGEINPSQLLFRSCDVTSLLQCERSCTNVPVGKQILVKYSQIETIEKRYLELQQKTIALCAEVS